MNSVETYLYSCNRVAWGPFERGPIYVMQEWHGYFTAPESCLTNHTGLVARRVLESIWFSDSQVADYAKSVYGMPAYFANFTSTALDVGGAASQYTWTWSTNGSAPSHVTYNEPQYPMNETVTLGYRLFWYSGIGVSYMDWYDTSDARSVSSFTPMGTFAPPMMWGSYGPTPDFVMPRGGNLEGKASLKSTIFRFGDTECNKPL
jgi:hypothetical protein